MQQSFTLKPLPPLDLDLSGSLRLIADVREAVVRYDESVQRLPNPDLISMSFASKEAVLSSRIEGTQATLRDVLVYDALQHNKQLTDRGKDYREIVNYRQSINQGYQALTSGGDISKDLIRELHSLLLDSVRGQDKHPGHFRQDQVWIGHPGATIKEARYVPPPADEVEGLMDNLMEFIHSDQPEFDSLIRAAIMHYQFEAIHPFSDGNGRIGRLLITLYIYKQGLTAVPNLYVSEFFERYRREYYDSLHSVSAEGDWLGWVTFFMMATREQAKRSQDRVARIDSLYQEIKASLMAINSKYALPFLEAMFKKPIFSPRDIASLTGIGSYQTVFNLIAKFESQGHVESSISTAHGSKKKLLFFSKLLDILEESES